MPTTLAWSRQGIFPHLRCQARYSGIELAIWVAIGTWVVFTWLPWLPAHLGGESTNEAWQCYSYEEFIKARVVLHIGV